jgi:hypothetical protein
VTLGKVLNLNLKRTEIATDDTDCTDQKNLCHPCHLWQNTALYFMKAQAEESDVELKTQN